jgi:hypothetical protein
MHRRRAITTAAAASLTLLAGAAGIALNSGIVGARGDNNVGQLTPLGTATRPTTVIAAEPATTATTGLAATPPVQASDSQPVATSSASSTGDDSRYDDEDEHGDDEHEAEDHEYEGAEDDD